MTNKLPEISKEQLVERALKIKPVARKGGALRYMEPVDIEATAFTWDPDFVDRADTLQEFKRIRTLHTYSYGGFFKPSIKEVLSQLPEDILDRVTAFETRPVSNIASEAMSGGYHVAETILYMGSLPEQIARQDILYKNKRVLAQTFQRVVDGKSKKNTKQAVKQAVSKPLKLKRRPKL